MCVKCQSKLPFLSPLQDFPYLVDMVWENRPGDFQDVDMVNCSIHLCLLHQWMLHLQCKRDFIDFTDHNPHNFKASNVLLCNNYPWHCEDDSSSKWKVNHLKYARAHVPGIFFNLQDALLYKEYSSVFISSISLTISCTFLFKKYICKNLMSLQDL